MSMDISTATGKRLMERIRIERTIWLTTVSKSGLPSPRPVWFVYDDTGDFIIYSSKLSKKLEHISQNPDVALHFNAGEDGYDVQVVLGKAKTDASLPPSNLNKAYSEKYGAEILTLDMNEEKYAGIFSVGIRITPIRLRGLEPIPEG